MVNKLKLQVRHLVIQNYFCKIRQTGAASLSEIFQNLYKLGHITIYW